MEAPFHGLRPETEGYYPEPGRLIPDFKRQVTADTSHVFLNPREFGEIREIEYWRDGYSPAEPGHKPTILRIPVVIETSGTSDSSWQKNSQRARAGSTIMYQKDDNVLYKNRVEMFCRKSDFEETPKRGRRIRMDGRVYKIYLVQEKADLLEITLEEFDD